MANKLVIPVKQGEEFNVGFTIDAGDSPMDLSGYRIRFLVKEVPLEKYPALIDKTITEDSDPDEEGYIAFSDQGSVVVHLTKEDTSHHIGEYALIIAVEADNYFDIISSGCDSNAVFRICEQ